MYVYVSASLINGYCGFAFHIVSPPPFFQPLFFSGHQYLDITIPPEELLMRSLWGNLSVYDQAGRISLSVSCTLIFSERLPFADKVSLLASGAGTPGFQLLEEVVALVIHQDKGGEVLHRDFPDGLHTQFGIFHALDALDAAL